MKDLNHIKLFLLDMDGTFYLGNQLLEGSKQFVDTIAQLKGRDFLFLTNNSSKNSYHYLEKLEKMGFLFPPEKIMTSGEATIHYLQEQYPNQKVYLVGTDSLKQEFLQSNILLTEYDPDIAVLGFDTSLTYEKLWKLCDFVRTGKPFVATHPDLNCPIEGGYMPDIGGVIAFVEACTNRKPDVVIGKPNRSIIQAVSNKLQIPFDEIAMVGDRLYTDIAVGIHANITSILVLTGETSLSDLENSQIQPDYIFKNLGELAEKLKFLED